MSLVKISNLSFSYDNLKSKSQQMNKERLVLDALSLQIDKNETVGIIGRNGIGKSTLLKLLVGIERTTDDKSLLLFDMPVTKKNIQEIRKRTGYVFQDSESQLFMSTVYEDVAFGPVNYGYTDGEVEERTRNALEKVHMEAFAEKRIYQLSGGEKKLASIATVLPMEPELILLDEPSVALDPQNRRNLIHVLNEIQTTKIIASHDLDFVYDTCERTILLNQGKIAADGKTKEILRNKTLLEKNGLELPLSFSRI